MTIPDNFKTGITGAELLKVGIQCAEDAGFKWPEDWQYMRGDGWNDCSHDKDAFFTDWIYRINPERLKPKAPRVGKMCRNNKIYDVIDAIELTDQVRRRLSKDAGVDWDEMIGNADSIHDKELLQVIRRTVAAAAVEVKE